MTRILIADDHAILRRGLREILAKEIHPLTCGEAENAEQLFDLVKREPWDLLILDLTMPGRSGLDLLQALKTQHPALPVLVLSMHSEDQYGKRVLRAGAAGFMNKESAPEALLKAVWTITAGGRYVSDALAQRLAGDLDPATTGPPHEALSAREFEVMRLLAAGRTVGEIATQLLISDKTVSTYRARILDKLRLRTNADLTRYGIEHHLLD